MTYFDGQTPIILSITKYDSEEWFVVDSSGKRFIFKFALFAF
jgi:hypothetical protein